MSHARPQTLIPPRTAKESEAYEAGYVQALLDLQTHGWAFVIRTVRLMGDLHDSDANS